MKSKRGRPPGQFKGRYPKSIGGKITRAFSKYQSMIARCYQKSHPSYEHYSGKGITVCEHWRGPEGFYNFFDDMGNPPEGLTLERVNNAKGYSPDNCRWATWQEQADNRDKGGPPINPNSLKQKAKAAGLSYHLVYFRVKKFGWSEREALTTPVLPRGRRTGANKGNGYRVGER